MSADTVNFWSCGWLGETVASLGFLQQREQGRVTPAVPYIKASPYVRHIKPRGQMSPFRLLLKSGDDIIRAGSAVSHG